MVAAALCGGRDARSFSNADVSSRPRRIATATTASAAPTMNGIRQPHDSKSAGDIVRCNNSSIASANNWPMISVTY